MNNLQSSDKTIIEAAGGVYVGIQNFPSKSFILFNEPSGSTLALEVGNVTPEAVKEKIQQFENQTTNIHNLTKEKQMERYNVRANGLALVDNNGDYQVELDSACNHPDVIFDTFESAQAEATRLNDSGNYPAAQFVVTPIEVLEENIL